MRTSEMFSMVSGQVDVETTGASRQALRVRAEPTVIVDRRALLPTLLERLRRLM